LRASRPSVCASSSSPCDFVRHGRNRTSQPVARGLQPRRYSQNRDHAPCTSISRQ